VRARPSCFRRQFGRVNWCRFMAKKVIGVVGSYRKGRVIDSAVSEVLKKAEAAGAETAKVYLIDKHIEFCTNCRSCTQQKDPYPRATCIHSDDLEPLLQEIDAADGLVLGSPVNFGNVTAVTRRMLERLLVYVYWPWGAKMPKLRIKKRTKKAVIVTASACPAWLARIIMRAPLRALKAMANCLGANVVASLYFGTVAQAADHKLGAKCLAKAHKAGEKLAS